MWVEKTPAGKYKYVEQYTDYMTGKKKRVSVTLDKDSAAAKRNALQILSRMIGQRQEQPEAMQAYTLQDVIQKYLTEQQQTVKASTFARNRCQMKAIIQILGADTLMERLTAGYIRSKFLKTGENAGRLNERRTRLAAMINWAYENDYISNTDCIRKFKPFKDSTKREKIQDKYLEADELERLIDGMTVKKWKLLTRFLVLSGLRIGEVTALCTSDLDFKNKLIHVNKTYDVNNRIVTTPKTQCSVRDVYIQPELEPVCREIILHTKMESLAYNFRTPLFLCSRNGKYLNPFSYNKYLREYSKRLIGRKITAHALRHTHASLLLANGVDIDTIARRLGHENSKITREIYLHITKELTKKDNLQIRNSKII